MYPLLIFNFIDASSLRKLARFRLPRRLPHFTHLRRRLARFKVEPYKYASFGCSVAVL